MRMQDGASVVVVGGGLAGLVAARKFALQGYQVTVFEATGSCGGAAKLHTVGGLALDAGAESLATIHAGSHALIDELGLTDHVVSPLDKPAWLFLDSGSSPLPGDSMWGIPIYPLSDAVVAILGRQSALAAAQDLLGVLDDAQRVRLEDPELTLGELVESRMGKAVVDRLVAPVVMGVQSIHPNDVQADIIVPGLRQACVDEGGLIKAVSHLKQRANSKTPGANVIGLRGGVGTLSERLVNEVFDLGATIVTTSVVNEITEASAAQRVAGKPRYRVRVKGYIDDGLARGFEAGGGRIRFVSDASYATTIVEADIVVLAVAPSIAQSILRKVAPTVSEKLEAEPAPIVAHLASLIVHAPEWDAAPCGTGALIAPGTAGIRAKALTHASAKWQWVQDMLDQAFGSSHHLVRLSYLNLPGLPGRGEKVLRDAEAVLGERGCDQEPLAFKSVTWSEQQAVRYPGQLELVAQVRQSLASLSTGRDHLAIVGSWAAGSSIGRVVTDAAAEVDRIVGLDMNR